MIRRRYIDRGAFMVRHDDGLKDLINTLIGKCKDMINTFKQLPSGRKVVYLLGRLAQVAGGILTVTNGVDVYKNIKTAKAVNAALQEAAEAGLLEDLDSGNSPSGFSPTLKSAIIKAGLKAIGGLVAAIAGTAAETYAKSK